jgi:predicted protein tyrosine phosphatase
MKVNVYSRKQAIDLVPAEGTVVISISGPDNEAPLKEGWEDILRLAFHDVALDPDACRIQGIQSIAGKPIIFFDEEMAAQVDTFAFKHKDKDFMVHCDAGVSRSVAVGLFLKELFEAELTTHAIHTTAAYNSLVHRILLQKYWKEHLLL